MNRSRGTLTEEAKEGRKERTNNRRTKAAVIRIQSAKILLAGKAVAVTCAKSERSPISLTNGLGRTDSLPAVHLMTGGSREHGRPRAREMGPSFLRCSTTFNIDTGYYSRLRGTHHQTDTASILSSPPPVPLFNVPSALNGEKV